MERENTVPIGKATTSTAGDDYHGNYKVEILCVSEARWTDSERRIIASGHTIFHSGRTDNLHRGGVAYIVTRKVEDTSLEWKPVNLFMKSDSTQSISGMQLSSAITLQTSRVKPRNQSEVAGREPGGREAEGGREERGTQGTRAKPGNLLVLL